MKKQLLFFILLLPGLTVLAQNRTITFQANTLKDKIRGGWAGQTIGVTYGGPVEFRYNGTMINKYHPIPWYNGYLKETMVNNPGLYDDLYMDITFVEVMDREGLNAPISSHAKAYAHAGYALWHANQAGRYNILNGIAAPASGHWLNNPHADCIDYQIECDFAGLMSPGMPNAASEISNKIGHIMNYGDGYYGGVFLGACYTQAFLYNDISKVVNEALKTIPKESTYYKCIADVIKWHQLYPNDWTKTWLEVQKKYTDDIGCPDGVYAPFNIDATVNSAYVVMGLLYGNGDFTKTIDVATHCGQDADCNPSSAAGILGVMLGYEKIPAYWKQGLKEAEDIDFKYTSTSLNKVYQLSYQQAIKNIENHGGSIKGELISIPQSPIMTVPFEESFSGIAPKEKINLGKSLKDEQEFSFTGTGYVLRGEASKWGVTLQDFFEMEVWVDGKLFEKVKLPVSFTTRRHELSWNYQLPDGLHKIKLKLLNQVPGFECKLQDVIVYKKR